MISRTKKPRKEDEMDLVLARGADREPDVLCEGIERFRTNCCVGGIKVRLERGKFEHTEGRVVGPAYVALWGAGKVSR